MYPNQYNPQGGYPPQQGYPPQYQQRPPYGQYPPQQNAGYPPQQNPMQYQQYPYGQGQYNYQQNPQQAAKPQNNAQQQTLPPQAANYSGSFIPPATRPTRAYIPPPKQPLSFKFSASNASGCEFLYGVMMAFQVLLDEYSNGNVDTSAYEAKLESLKRALGNALAASKLGINELRDFVDACEMDADAALEYVLNLPEFKPKKKAKDSDLLDLGTYRIQLLDSASSPISQLRNIFLAYHITINRTCPDNTMQQAKAKIENWNRIFESKQGTDTLSPDEQSRFCDDVENLFSLVTSGN